LTITSPLQIRHACADQRKANLGLEVAGGDRRTGLLVRGDGKGILVVARDLPLRGNLLGGDAHPETNRVVLFPRKSPG
jgi:hypothetical protein